MAEWTNPRLKGRIPELDGVRGLAISLVIVCHYAADSVHRTPGSPGSYLLKILTLSWSGVDLFFVLSGFLIGGILWDARGADNYFSAFYFRRAYRIWPVLFGWIAIFLIATPLSTHPIWGAIFGHQIPTWTYLLFCQNIPRAIKRSFGSQWLAGTWSLAVEEQFYLLLPIAVLAVSSARKLAMWVGAASLAAIGFRAGFALAGNTYNAPYMLLVCRADALGCGVLAALAVRNATIWNWLENHPGKLKATAGILALGLAPLTVYPVGWLMNTVGYTWLALFYSSVLLLALTRGSALLNRLLLFQPLRSLGMIAYGVYICHEPLFAVSNAILYGRRYGEIASLPEAAVALAALGFSIGLSLLSWKLMEKPLLRRAAALHPYRRTAELPAGVA